MNPAPSEAASSPEQAGQETIGIDLAERHKAGLTIDALVAAGVTSVSTPTAVREPTRPEPTS